MALAQITYVNKINSNPIIDTTRQITAEDLNEIKLKFNDTVDFINNDLEVGAGSVRIPVAYSNQSAMSSYLYHSIHTVKNTTPHAEVHSRDAWVGPASEQRLLYMFGDIKRALKSIFYINYYNNNNGTLNPVSGTNTHGIKTCKIYAVTTPNFVPAATYDAVGSELELIFSGDFEMHQLNRIYGIELNEAIECYGIVIDILDNYGGPSCGLRRIYFTT